MHHAHMHTHFFLPLNSMNHLQGREREFCFGEHSLIYQVVICKRSGIKGFKRFYSIQIVEFVLFWWPSFPLTINMAKSSVGNRVMMTKFIAKPCVLFTIILSC